MKLAAFTDVSDVARLGLHLAAAPWLPWRGERRAAHAITDLALPRLGALQARVAHGLTACLGATHTPEEIAALTRANIAHRWTEREIVWLWRMAWSARRRRVLTRAVAITGREHLSTSLARGRGALLLEAHLGKRVLAREALREAGFTVCQVHAPHHGGEPTWLGQRGLRRLHRALARRSGLEIVEIAPDSLAYVRALTVRLQRNEVVAMSGLGTIGHKFVAVEALGTTLAVPTGIASLARATGAALLPLFAFEDAAGFDQVVVETPLTPPDEGDAGLAAWAERYVAVLERYVRRHPEQWFWWFAVPSANAVPATARRVVAHRATRD